MTTIELKEMLKSNPDASLLELSENGYESLLADATPPRDQIELKFSRRGKITAYVNPISDNSVTIMTDRSIKDGSFCLT